MHVAALRGCGSNWMRIDFLGLEAFLSIAERGSFQRAAAHLNLSQAAISHRTCKLEEELGLKLFARTTREVTLTRAGIDFLPNVRKDENRSPLFRYLFCKRYGQRKRLL